MKVLHLTLKRQPFEVMVSGEKKTEFREPSKWIMSRLFDKEGKKKPYFAVCFKNGYSKDAPQFTALFEGSQLWGASSQILKYSNGLEVLVINNKTICINIGKIISTKNVNGLQPENK
jgi:hypothetical protein